jgi:hypothetical protein
MVPTKGGEWVVKTLVKIIDSHGYGRVLLKSDNERAIVAVQKAVQAARTAETAIDDQLRETMEELAPRGDSQSNGAAENAVREVEGMLRTWKLHVEEKLNCVIDNKHVLLPWLVQHAGHIITRYKMGADGKTAYQRLKGKRPSGRIMPFGETILWMQPKGTEKRANKLEPKHHYGVFVGVEPKSGEFLVLTPDGAVRARTVHRLQPDKRWDLEFVSSVKGAPWDHEAHPGEVAPPGVIPMPVVPATPLPDPAEVPPAAARHVQIRHAERGDGEVPQMPGSAAEGA